MNAQQADAAIDASLTSSDRVAEQMLTEISTTIAELSKRIRAAEEESTRAARTASITLVLAAIVALALAIATGWTLSRAITSAIDEVVGVARRLARGDVDQKIEVTRCDELGELQQHMAALIDSTRETSNAAEKLAFGDFRAAGGRLAKRLRHHGAQSVRDYLGLIARDSNERVQMIDAILTNETRFFRDPQQFTFLEQSLIPRWKEEKRDAIRVWSAACSTGEEPYSLAMTLLSAGMRPEILATDLSTKRSRPREPASGRCAAPNRSRRISCASTCSTEKTNSAATSPPARRCAR